MDRIVKLVSEKAGISEAQARTAVNTVVGFLKDRMPAGMGAQVEKFLQDDTGTGGGDIGGMKDKLGGMFGKK